MDDECKECEYYDHENGICKEFSCNPFFCDEPLPCEIDKQEDPARQRSFSRPFQKARYIHPYRYFSAAQKGSHRWHRCMDGLLCVFPY